MKHAGGKRVAATGNGAASADPSVPDAGRTRAGNGAGMSTAAAARIKNKTTPSKFGAKAVNGNFL